MNTID